MGVPDVDNARLLFTLIPGRRENDKGRLADGLEETHKGAQDDQGCEIRRRGNQGYADAPEGDVQGKPFGRGNALDDPVFLTINIKNAFRERGVPGTR